MGAKVRLYNSSYSIVDSGEHTAHDGQYLLCCASFELKNIHAIMVQGNIRSKGCSLLRSSQSQSFPGLVNSVIADFGGAYSEIYMYVRDIRETTYYRSQELISIQNSLQRNNFINIQSSQAAKATPTQAWL
ncbi:hypothetical protein Tco_0558292 [Tanacetum coccineum]